MKAAIKKSNDASMRARQLKKGAGKMGKRACEGNDYGRRIAQQRIWQSGRNA
jgi:hypothetical protein